MPEQKGNKQGVDRDAAEITVKLEPGRAQYANPLPVNRLHFCGSPTLQKASQSKHKSDFALTPTA